MVILVAVDGSENSRRAVQAAATFLGGISDSQFFVLHVEEDRQWERTLTAADVTELAAQAARALQEAGLQAETLLEVGPPARRILAVARRVGADLIVMGRRGLSPVARLITGSVSAAVLNEAPVPVLVIP